MSNYPYLRDLYASYRKSGGEKSFKAWKQMWRDSRFYRSLKGGPFE